MNIGVKYLRKRCNRLYCYGIGKWGRLVAKYCKKKHIEIDGFIVSNDKKINIDTFMGRPVRSISNTPIDKKDGIIIATVNDTYKMQMLEEIKELENVKYYFLNMNSSILHYYRKKYKKDILKRKKCHIFEYEKLCKPISINFECWPRYVDICSAFTYGNRKVIKKLVRNRYYDVYGCIIAHSASFVPPDLAWTTPHDGNVFAFSGKFWENIPNINLYCVGPIIRHTKPTLTYKQIDNLKKRFGRTLLVFPAHGTSSGTAQYDYVSFVKEINRIRKIGNYMTVVACIYYQDFYFGVHRLYQSEGYKIVTAGHEFDENFLRRLKSILLLSDMVMSNGNGSHIGYAVALGIPAYCFGMDIYNPDDERYNNGERMVFGEVNALDVSTKIHNEVSSQFSVYNEFITSEQKEVVKKYWGDWSGRKKIEKHKYIAI